MMPLYIMFARFRQPRDRLNVSIVETTRNCTSVRQSHVASLGSVPLPPTPADRVQLWVRLHQRLATLSNRLDDARQRAILAAVHTRIPMPTAVGAAIPAGRRTQGSLRHCEKHRGLAEVHRTWADREAAAAESVDRLEDAHANRPMTRADMRRLAKALD